MTATTARRVLGVSSSASAEQVKKAYRKAVQRTHPDKGGAEADFLEVKLAEHDWNVSETARRLGMPRSNLYKKIEKYGLSRR